MSITEGSRAEPHPHRQGHVSGLPEAMGAPRSEAERRSALSRRLSAGLGEIERYAAEVDPEILRDEYVELARSLIRLRQSYQGLHARGSLGRREEREHLLQRAEMLKLRASVISELRSLAAIHTQPTVDRVPGHAGGAPSAVHRTSWLDRRHVRKILTKTGLFSPSWYRSLYPDAGSLSDADALENFLAVGLDQDRDPHPLFSSAWARRGAPRATGPALLAFFAGAAPDPHPLFDTAYYLETYPDVRNSGDNALVHYVMHGARERRRPHLAFDPAWYEQRRGGTGVPDLLADYLSDPAAFELDPHPLFKAPHYLAQTRGLRERRINPLVHYLVEGWRAALSPHPLFETAFYLSRSPDIEELGLNPFVHFLKHGANEGRPAHPLFDAQWYLETYPDIGAAPANPLIHYVSAGAFDGHLPGPDFPMQAFREAFPDFRRGAETPPERLLTGAGLEPASSRSRPWLPDPLQGYLANRYDPTTVGSLLQLMQVALEFGERPAEFATSSDFDHLVQRARDLAADEPGGPVDVSIVIPVHNAIPYTLACVVSVLQDSTRFRFEILIGDDASTDATAATFSEMGGRIRHIRSDSNLGFLENCNAVAARACGRYLVFLNNDTVVLPGWLDELVGTFERHPTAGYVGSKLLNGDGTLQEAGGIFWNDGSAWNFGRGQDPASPEFNYVKDVDYCSGASIAVPKALWDELGGFDRIFKPAYCEDSDLAFRIRAAGYRCMLQPFSELVHHEGRSHGRDESQGIKAYQVRNQQRLFGRWAKTLERENFESGQHVTLARDRSRHRLHILIIDHYVPQWDRDAGSRTMLHFIRLFVSRGFQVTFWPDNLYRDPTYAKPLQQMGVEVIYGPEFQGQFESWFSSHGERFNYVLLSRPHIATTYIDFLAGHVKPKLLYYGHDLHWKRLMDQYLVTGDAKDLREAERVRDQELDLAQRSELTIFPSETERQILQDLVGDRTKVVAVPAWIFEQHELDSAEKAIDERRGADTRQLLFVGGFGHGPNADGLVWFVEKVFPLILSEDSRFRLTVVGSNPTEQVKALAGPSIEITGQISDEALAEQYRKAAISIAPLRFGGGVKGKVIEAFAKGLPVVSTSVGMQGIPDGAHLAFLADEPIDFAASVLFAARDREASRAKASAALEFLRVWYTPEALAQKLFPGVPELVRPVDEAKDWSALIPR